MSINLHLNNGFKWFVQDGIYTKGYFVDSNNDIYEDEKINSYFRGITTLEEFEHKLKRINGSFSIIIDTEDYVYIGMDHIRSFPIFYTKQNNIYEISDDIFSLSSNLMLNEIHNDNLLELLMTGYITGNNTLLNNVEQSSAGEITVISKKDQVIEVKYGYNIDKESKVLNSYSDYSKKMEITLKNIFSDFIKTLDGRPIVIPLSGGYDSRLLAYYVKELGYENVFCYTYGNSNQIDVKLSKSVAESLNLKWIFVPYDRSFLFQTFNSNEAYKYRKFASNGYALPHIQDYCAVEYLHKNQLIPENAVFVPGHTAMLSFQGISSGSVVEDLKNKHYSLWKSGILSRDNKIFNKRIQDVLSKYQEYIDGDNYVAFYIWEWQERHSKYICNSVRVYEHFGYKWMMPLWDNRLINLWLNIPNEEKKDKILLKRYMSEKFKYDILPPNPKRSLVLKVKEKIYGYHKLGRYSGQYSIFKSFLVKNRDIILKENQFFSNHSFIDANKLIIMEHPIALVAIKFLNDLKTYNFVEKIE